MDVPTGSLDIASEVASVSASRPDRRAAESSASLTMPSASSARPSRGTVIDAATITRADMTVSVSLSDAHACVARPDALINAIGLYTSSPLPTTQSSAFFRHPVGVFRTRDQDRIAGLQSAPKRGDRRRQAIVVDIRIKGRQIGQATIDEHFHDLRSQSGDRVDKRRV